VSEFEPNAGCTPDAQRRLRTRAATLRPGAREITIDLGEGSPDSSNRPEIIARAVPEATPPLTGYRLTSIRSFKTYLPLYTVLAKIHPRLGRAFEPHQFFSHVGDRPCGQRVPGWREEYWLREDLAPANAVPLTTSGGLPLACVTAGGIGLLPVVGATLASLATTIVLGPALLFYSLPVATGIVALVLLISTVLCVALEPWATRWFLDKDAREFVLDEVAGMAITLLVVQPTSILALLAAFVAFRFFDVLKPGIHWIEERGWRGTVVWDDLLAGVMAGGALLSLGKLIAVFGGAH